jgi:hypothetical protein
MRKKMAKGERITIADRINALMSDGMMRTALQVATSCDADLTYVRDLLGHMVANRRAHVSGYANPNRAKMYRYGPGENVPKPLLKTCGAQRERYEARRREGCRTATTAPAPWWPAADEVLVNAVRAMIDAGTHRSAERARFDLD